MYLIHVIIINLFFTNLSAGYLIAEVRNNGMRIAAEYEKAMRVCDNTGTLSTPHRKEQGCLNRHYVIKFLQFILICYSGHFS